MTLGPVILALLTCSASSLTFPKLNSGGEKEGESFDLVDSEELPKAGTKERRAKDMQGLRNQSIVFYGDSIAEHWSGEEGGRKLKKFSERPALWKKYFVDRYGPSHVSGIAGDRTPHLLDRIQHGEGPKNAQPRVIMIHIGTNDFKKTHEPKEIFNRYEQIVQELQKASPQSEILLTAVFPKSEQWGPEPSQIKETITDLNKMIASLAEKPKIHFSNCGHAMLKKDGKIDPELSPDYLHHSDAGAEAWAKCLRPTLDKILGINGM